MSSEIEEGGVEETTEEVKTVEEEIEEEPPVYDVTKPEMLEIMLEVTDTLDKVVSGQISLEEAKRELQLARSGLDRLIKEDVVTKKKGKGRKQKKQKRGGSKKGGKSG